MSALFSALIPTRTRPAGLMRTVQSLIAHVDDPASMQIILRIDDDDKETIQALRDNPELGRLDCFIGSRYSGYDSMGKFVSEIANLSTAPWVFLIDDDAEVTGDTKIDTELAKVPQGNGNVATCEYYKMNHSLYRAATPVGMFVPTNAWKQFGYEICCSPVDMFWHQLFVADNKWKVNLLNGLTYVHDWKGMAHHYE